MRPLRPNVQIGKLEEMRNQDRTDAGRQLGVALGDLAGDPSVMVLALPRGGVPVAAEVALALEAPLDVLVVRKVGVPGHSELAMGAITADTVYIDYDMVARLGVSPGQVAAVIERERAEVERRELRYRSGRDPLDLTGRTALLIDDGLATGSTMIAAVRAVREMEAALVVVAIPTAPAAAIATLEQEADRVVCLDSPRWFHAVGQWYVDFTQTTDEEVRNLLAAHPD